MSRYSERKAPVEELRNCFAEESIDDTVARARSRLRLTMERVNELRLPISASHRMHEVWERISDLKWILQDVCYSLVEAEERLSRIERAQQRLGLRSD